MDIKKLKTYLIDVKGYSLDDLNDMTVKDLLQLIDDKKEYKNFNK